MKRAQLLIAWLSFNRQEDMQEIRNQREANTSRYPWILEALIFWRFVLRINRCPDKEKTAAEELRAFLQYFQASVNPFIRLVAMIECLPTLAFRKILWKYNIDFMSFESFLRRITVQQMNSIADNYQQFINGGVPVVCKKGIGRIETYAALVNSEQQYAETRYNTKGAMSYNLLSLDFGFNAFPKGVTDDTKVIEVSPFKFLSVKDHADDFIVNKEFGRYYWLYKKARSNFAYRPNREVEIKTHVCPGFWYTLIIHFLFWIVSPLLCGLQLSVIDFTPHSLRLSELLPSLILLPALFMPLWLIAAGFRGIFLGFAAVWKKMPDSVKEGFGEWMKNYLIAVGKFLLMIVVSVGTLLVILLFSGIVMPGILFYRIINLICLFSIFSILYSSVIKIEDSKIKLQAPSKKAKDDSYYFVVAYVASGLIERIDVILQKIWSILVVIGEFFVLVWIYIADAAIYVYEAFDYVLSSLGLAGISLLVGILLPVVALYFVDRYSDEKKYPRLSHFAIRTFPRILIVLVVGQVVFIAYCLFSGTSNYYYNSASNTYIIIALALYMVVVFADWIVMKSLVYKYDKKIAVFVEIFKEYSRDFSDYRINMASAAYTAADNGYISRKIKAKKRDIIRTFIIAARILGNDGDYYKFTTRREIFDQLLMYVTNDKIYQRIKEGSKEYLESGRSFYDYVFPYQFRRFILLLNENDFIPAMKEMKDERLTEEHEKSVREAEKKNARIEKIEKVFSRIKIPFVKIGEFFSALYGIYEWFNKRCPYVQKERKISL